MPAKDQRDPTMLPYSMHLIASFVAAAGDSAFYYIAADTDFVAGAEDVVKVHDHLQVTQAAAIGETVTMQCRGSDHTGSHITWYHDRYSRSVLSGEPITVCVYYVVRSHRFIISSVYN